MVRRRCSDEGDEEEAEEKERVLECMILGFVTVVHVTLSLDAVSQ